MPRRVFFSFHYERDNQRASIVRNSWVTKPDREEAGFIDAASWEGIEKQGEAAIKRWIDRQMDGTSVTVVLIGTETSSRNWVRYEIIKSYERGNGVFGITIHSIRDFKNETDVPGDLFFGEITKDRRGQSLYFYHLYPTYDWMRDNGYKNLGSWVELAAARAGKEIYRVGHSSRTRKIGVADRQKESALPFFPVPIRTGTPLTHSM